MNLKQMLKDGLAAAVVTQRPKKFRIKKYPKQKPLLDNPEWEYRNSASTNVLETMKRQGWTPPSERKEKA